MAKSYQVDFRFAGLVAGIQQMRALVLQTQQATAANLALAASVQLVGNQYRRLYLYQAAMSRLPAPKMPGGGGGGAGGALQMQQLIVLTRYHIGVSQAGFQALIAALQAQQPGPGGGGRGGGRRPTSFIQRLAQLIGTTRLGFGGGGGVQVMPLISRIVALFTPTGPLGDAIKIAGGALVAFAATAALAAKSLQEFRIGGILSGGTAGEMSRLTSFGVPAGDVANRAAGLTQRMSMLGGDTFTQLAGMKLGVQLPIGRPFGKTNEAETFLAVIEGLRKVKDAEEQLRLVRMLGLEVDIALINMSERVFNEMKRDAEVRKKIFDDPKAQQNAADFAGELIRMANAFENIRTAAGKGLIPELAQAADGMANLANAMAMALDKNLVAFTNALKVLYGITPGGWIMQYNLWFLKLFGGGKSGHDPHTDALKANTDALNNLAGVFAPGTYGGGDRARGAVPSELKGLMLGGAIAGNSLRLGAFTL